MILITSLKSVPKKPYLFVHLLKNKMKEKQGFLPCGVFVFVS